jgi:hypothetical protein
MAMHHNIVTFAANDHLELELQMQAWFRKYRPKRIIAHDFAADGTEYAFCYVLIYEPRDLPLPKPKRRGK